MQTSLKDGWRDGVITTEHKAHDLLQKTRQNATLKYVHRCCTGNWTKAAFSQHNQIGAPTCIFHVSLTSCHFPCSAFSFGDVLLANLSITEFKSFRAGIFPLPPPLNPHDASPTRDTLYTHQQILITASEDILSFLLNGGIPSLNNVDWMKTGLQLNPLTTV